MQTADPRTRRRAFVLIGGAAVVGAVVILLADVYRQPVVEWVEADPGPRLRLAIVVTAIAVCVPPVAMAGGLLWLARRIWSANRFPAAGMAVTRDTPTRTGTGARRLAFICVVAAGLSLVAAVGIAVALWRIALTIPPPG